MKKALTDKHIDEIEDKLAQVMLELAPTEGDLDVDKEFDKLMFSKAGPSDATAEEIRQMTRRFGPKLIKLMGLPPAPGACRVIVSEDGMEAKLEIDPPAGDGATVTEDDARKAIAAREIVFGLDEKEILAAVEAGKTAEVRDILIARGRPVTPGRDGYIERLDVKKPEERAPSGAAGAEGSGNITAAAIDTVKKDQKIAKLVEPQSGEAGKDVFGNDIPPPPVVPVSPEPGANVSFDANEGVFFSKAPGRVVIDSSFIDIEKMHEVRGDVDISVGHIVFPGEIMIRGSVRSGLTIDAEKDIVIEGGVEAASVQSSDGSIFIGKGVQGSGRAMVRAAWDVTAKFMEQAAVMAGGVIRTQNAIRCELAAGDAVMVSEGKGVVIGGKIHAGKRVEVRELGGGSGAPTVVQLGITPESMMALSKLKTRKQAAHKALGDAEETLARFGLSAEAIQSDSVTDEGRKLLRLAKTIVVLQSRCRAIEDEEDKFLAEMKNRGGGEVDVRGRVYPGVKILIGPAIYEVTTPLSWVRFKFDAAKRKIKVVTLT